MAAVHPLAPARTTLMIKPVGGLCNLDCQYCYYLPTIDEVYGGHEQRMSLETLESVFAGYLPHASRQVTIAWQGGEPTLTGLGFFRKAIEFQHKYARPGQQISHALQTNGTLLDDEWCRFFRENKFLIGISIDGLGDDHDHYRVDKQGRPSFDRVMQGLRLLRHHQVEHNILCVLNDRNVKHPRKVFEALLKLGEKWMQFIPAVEWVEAQGTHTPRLAPFSPDPDDYGRFLCEVFDLWFDRYRDTISVRHFDSILGALVQGQATICILGPQCHSQLTVEHNGDLFGCDHFVERRWQLGQINPAPNVPLTIQGQPPTQAESSAEQIPLDPDWLDRSDAQKLGQFAARKQHLPEACSRCEWKLLCFGGCPKHRPHRGDVAEPTILCPAYKRFNAHAIMRLEWLANYLRAGTPPPPPEGAALKRRRT
jgi:uncharacterized protein